MEMDENFVVCRQLFERVRGGDKKKLIGRIISAQYRGTVNTARATTTTKTPPLSTTGGVRASDSPFFSQSIRIRAISAESLCLSVPLYIQHPVVGPRLQFPLPSSGLPSPPP